MSVSRKRKTRSLRAELLGYSGTPSWFWFGCYLRGVKS